MDERPDPLAWLVVWRTDMSEFRVIREDHLDTYTAEFPDHAPFDGPDRGGAEWTSYGAEAFGDPVTAALAAAHIAAGLTNDGGAVHPWRVEPEQLIEPPAPPRLTLAGRTRPVALMPPIDLVPRDGGTYQVISGTTRMAAARDLGIVRLKGRVLDLAEAPTNVWLTLTRDGFTVEPRTEEDWPMSTSVTIHIDRSALDLSLMLREIDPAAYAETLLIHIRQELPVLSPLSDQAILSMVPALPAEVLAAAAALPELVELDTDGVSYSVLAGHQTLTDARAAGVARVRGTVLDPQSTRHPVWLVLTPTGFTVEPADLSDAPRGA